MKKVIIGVVAAGATLGFLPVIRRKAHKARQHCEQMAVKCKQMIAPSETGAEEAAGTRERSKRVTSKHNDKMDQFGVRAARTRAREDAERRLRRPVVAARR
jgi:hypothetical protein